MRMLLPSAPANAARRPPQIVLVPAHIHGDESANDDCPIAGRMSFDFDCVGWDGAASETITASTIIVDGG